MSLKAPLPPPPPGGTAKRAREISPLDIRAVTPAGDVGGHRSHRVHLVSLGVYRPPKIPVALRVDGALTQRGVFAFGSLADVRCWGKSGRSNDMAGESAFSQFQTFRIRISRCDSAPGSRIHAI